MMKYIVMSGYFDWQVFILPPESGEKVSLGVTILLSFSVFQFVIAENTPVNSDCTPLLSQ